MTTPLTTADKINAICCFLATVCVVFYVCGVTAYSNNSRDLDNVPWFLSTNKPIARFGLRSVTVENSGGETEYHNCSGDACDACDKDGKVAFALTLFSLVMGFLVAALAAANFASFDGIRQAAKIICTALAVVATIIALGVMMGHCKSKVENDGGDYDWGAGSILTLIAMLLMLITMCLLSVAAAVAAGEVAYNKAAVEAAAAAPAADTTTTAAKDANASSNAV
jgi:ABC-type Na+ efflux pump permease subunit